MGNTYQLLPEKRLSGTVFLTPSLVYDLKRIPLLQCQVEKVAFC